jgi:hypothetical protein
MVAVAEVAVVDTAVAVETARGKALRALLPAFARESK